MAECIECDGLLTGRQKKYCSATCQKAKGRADHLQKLYGISPADYEKILNAQGGKCGICKRPPKANKRLAVDHRHTNGQSGPITGLLCFLCNRRFLGARKEEIIIAMYEYITNPPALRALGREVIAPGKQKKRRSSKKRLPRKR